MTAPDERNFFVGNVWSWAPPRRFTYVHTVADVVPRAFLELYLRRLIRDFVEPDGALIVGSYGSQSRQEPPRALENLLPGYGISVEGTVRAGPGGIVCFAWSSPAVAGSS